MALYGTLQSLSTTAGSNAADGTVDAPSTIDNQMNSLAAFIAQMRDGQHEYVSSVGGTNTITGSIASNPTSYVVGRVYRFVAAAANTGAVTLNFNSIGAKSLLKVGNVALSGGELVATAAYEAMWDGVNFQLLGTYGFKKSHTTNGYQVLPSGLILQWGTAAPGTNSSSVALPTAFPNAFLAGFATSQGASVTANCPGGSTTTISIYTSTAGIALFWLAIGY